MDEGFTYMVTGKVIMDGEQVPIGTVVDEAKGWKYRDQLVSHGKLTRVTESAAEDAPRYERKERPEPADEVEESDEESEVENEEDETEDEESEDENEDDDELTQEQYNALNIDEVDAMLEAGDISIEEVDEFERNTGKDYRKGIEKLVYEEDEDDEGEDED